MPLVSGEDRGNGGELVWRDGRDAAFGGIDVRKVLTVPENLRWTLELRQIPPSASTLHSTGRIIEYGVVIDADGDQDADCQIGINNDAPKSGDLRVWVKNLRTGVINERVGPPYGYPIDFATPWEYAGTKPRIPPQMSFFFLAHTTGPCGRISDSASFYAWASIGDGQRVTAWDYAPDDGWLRMS